MKYSLLVALGALACAGRPFDPPDAPLDPMTGLPLDLGGTGLYSDPAARKIDPQNRAYTPGFTFWSDGAEKSRWIRLPAPIDASNPNEWHFPVGTRIWKEFRMGDVRIETRLLWKKDEGDWKMATYVWSADQSSATLATSYAPPPVPFPGTDSYEVPVTRCHTCHDGRADKVLGFEAALMAAPEASGLTLAQLRSEQLITGDGGSDMQFLAQASPLERKAAAYLHVNCGIPCHNASGNENVPFYARLEFAGAGLPQTMQATAIYMTAVDVASRFTPSKGSGPWFRISPKDPMHSTVYYRMSLRNGLSGGGEQMPPIDSHAIDADGVALIAQWIDSMQ